MCWSPTFYCFSWRSLGVHIVLTLLPSHGYCLAYLMWNFLKCVSLISRFMKGIKRWLSTCEDYAFGLSKHSFICEHGSYCLMTCLLFWFMFIQTFNWKAFYVVDVILLKLFTTKLPWCVSLPDEIKNLLFLAMSEKVAHWII